MALIIFNLSAGHVIAQKVGTISIGWNIVARMVGPISGQMELALPKLKRCKILCSLDWSDKHGSDSDKINFCANLLASRKIKGKFNVGRGIASV